MGDLAWENKMRMQPQRHGDTENSKIDFLLCGLCVSVVLFFAGCAKKEQAHADLILHHGKVVTVREVLRLKGPQTQVIDLKEKMVLPGLMDSHVHPTSAAMTEFDHPVPTMESIADLLEYIRARAAAVGEGKWVNVSQ